MTLSWKASAWSVITGLNSTGFCKRSLSMNFSKIFGKRKTSSINSISCPKVGRFASKYAPGGNLFYSRLAVQRLLWDQLQQAADPDANQSFRRIMQSARKDYGTEFWWRPGTNQKAELATDKLDFVTAPIYKPYTCSRSV